MILPDIAAGRDTRIDLPELAQLMVATGLRPGGIDGRVFPDARGGWRDRSNVGKASRAVRTGSDFEWVKTHTYRKTVATQDVYLGRRAGTPRTWQSLGW